MAYKTPGNHTNVWFPRPIEGVLTASRERLDIVLVKRGLVPTRSRARKLVAEGAVTVGGAPALKPSRLVSQAEAVEIAAETRFVGRGGEKLDAALTRFGIDAGGLRALDVGSSTGGFTDCLLRAGAAHVVAVDVGTHQLHETLRADPRVTSLEQTDIRAFDPDGRVGGRFELIVVDLSFISTTGLLGLLASLLSPTGDLIILVKPQFEAGRKEASRGAGVISDPAVWKRVLHELIDASPGAGLAVVDLALSPLRGGKGNVEFLARLRPADILGE